MPSPVGEVARITSDARKGPPNNNSHKAVARASRVAAGRGGRSPAAMGLFGSGFDQSADGFPLLADGATILDESDTPTPHRITNERGPAVQSS